MKKTNMSKLISKLATLCASFFTLALFVGANSNSSLMMHQAEVPAEIERFSLIK